MRYNLARPTAVRGDILLGRVAGGILLARLPIWHTTRLSSLLLLTIDQRRSREAPTAADTDQIVLASRPSTALQGALAPRGNLKCWLLESSAHCCDTTCALTCGQERTFTPPAPVNVYTFTVIEIGIDRTASRDMRYELHRADATARPVNCWSGSAMRFPKPPRGMVSWFGKRRSYDFNRAHADDSSSP